MRRNLLLPLIAALALVAAACNGDEVETPDVDDATPDTGEEAGPGDDEALERIAEAAENTVDQGTARFTLTMAAQDVDVDDGTQTPGTEDTTGTTDDTTGTTDDTTGTTDDTTGTTDDTTGTTDDTTGTTDDTTGTTDDAATTRAQGFQAEGEEDFDNDQRSIVFQGPQGTLEVIVDGTEAYVQLPATEDDDWLRVDLDELFQADLGIGGPAGLPFQSAQDNLNVLREAGQDVQEVGTEDVGGESTTHYTLTVDLQQAAQESDDDQVTQATEQMIAQTGVDQLDMAVWIDDEELIRQVAYSVDLGQAQVEGRPAPDTDDATTPGTDDTTGTTDDTTGTTDDTTGTTDDTTGTTDDTTGTTDDTTGTTDDTTTTQDPATQDQMGAQGNLIVTVEYYDFGADVDIQIPDDANVIDVDEGQLQQPPATDGTAPPTTDDPATDDPATDDPTTDDPTSDDPTTDDPTTNGTTTDDGTTNGTTTDNGTSNGTTTDDATPEPGTNG